MLSLRGNAGSEEKTINVSTNYKNYEVTLHCNVSKSDHGQLIGNDGTKISRLMDETGCKICLPSTKRAGSDGLESSRIIGNIFAVERARARIRKQTECVVSFPITYVSVPESRAIEMKPFIIHLKRRYGVRISIYCNRLENVSYVRVKSSITNVMNHKTAVTNLIYFFKLPIKTKVLLKVLLNNSVQEFMFTPDIENLIRNETNVSLTRLVDQSEPCKGELKIIGDVQDVMNAHCIIRGIAPVVLQFKLPRDIDRNIETAKQLVLGDLVHTVQNDKDVISIQGYEHDIGTIYFTYKYLTGMADSVMVQQAWYSEFVRGIIRNIYKMKSGTLREQIPRRLVNENFQRLAPRDPPANSGRRNGESSFRVKWYHNL